MLRKDAARLTVLRQVVLTIVPLLLPAGEGDGLRAGAAHAVARD